MRTRSVAVAAISALAGSAGGALAVPAAHAAPVPAAASAAVAVPLGGAVDVFVDTAAHGMTGLHGSITYSGGKIHDAAFSPDGTRLVFTDDAGALISMRPDGSGVVVLDSAPGHAQPTWAKNGAVVISYLGSGLVSTPASGGPSTPLPNSSGCSQPSGGHGSTIVYVRNAFSGTELEWRDLTTGQTRLLTANVGNQVGITPPGSSGTITVPGYEAPALSPDGVTVAYTGQYFVSGVGWATEIYTVPTDGSAAGGGGATRVSNGAVPGQPTAWTMHYGPSWSPDGSLLAFDASGANGFSTVPANNLAAAPTLLGLVDGDYPIHYKAVWQPSATAPPGGTPGTSGKLVERLDGGDRVMTAVEASQWAWSDHGLGGPRKTANVAVLSRSDLFADALSGSALAAHAGGPLLLTQTAGLNPATAAELRRTLAPGSPVYLLGGFSALSAQVEADVRAAGFSPVRLAGQTRYDTAVDVADTIAAATSTAPTVLLATGQNYPDALAAGAAAGSTPGGVVLLTNDTVMPAATSTWLGAHHATAVWAVGHQADKAAVSAHVAETPLAGGDRYVTATLVARQFFPAPTITGVATGATWPDALAGGALMGTYGGPLLLTGPATLDLGTAGYLSAASPAITTSLVFGGTGAVADGPLHAVGDAIGLPGSVRYAENDPGQR